MRTLKHLSLAIFSVAALALSLIILVTSTNTIRTNAQDAQNKTMAELITDLNGRFDGDKTFQFNVNIPYSFYNHTETFTIDNTSTKVTEIGNDHICMEDSTDPSLVQTYCYPYSTISVVYPVPKKK